MKFCFIAFSLFFVLTVTAVAQTPPSDSPKPKADELVRPTIPAVNPLKLTDAELSELLGLQSANQQLDRALNAKLAAMLAATCQGCNEADVVWPIVADARKFYAEQVQPSVIKYQKRLAEIAKAHDCEGCALGSDGVFVKAAK